MDWNRLEMLTRWLTFMAFLAGSANARSVDSGRRAPTVAPTCRVKGQPEVELVLGCGDGKYEGVVQFWHTPFGDLQPSALHTGLDSVFVHHDGSLVIPTSGLHHSGLYYCVLQHTEGSTLWPYELHVNPNNRDADGKHEQDDSCAALRSRRSRRSETDEEKQVPDGVFAGAVVASVLLTFVVGFSAGALTRSHVLRCLRAVTARLRSRKQRRRQADMTDHSSQVTVTTLPPMYESHALETETMRNESPTCRQVETRVSVTTPSPPAKPKRSFRHQKEEEPEATAYLEGCDYTKEEKMEVAGRGMGEIKEGSDEETKEEEETTQSSFYLEDEGTQSETDEDKSIDEREEKHGRESREEKHGGESREEKDGGDSREEKHGRESREEKHGGESREEKDGGDSREEKHGRESREEKHGGESREEKDGGDSREEKHGRESREEKHGGESREEKDGGDSREEKHGRESREEKHGGESREEKDGGDSREEKHGRESREEKHGGESREEKDGGDSREEKHGRESREEKHGGERAERSSENEETAMRNGPPEGEAPSSAPRRRSRVIRVYQYDEDGQRYGHLSGPGSEAPEPAPRLKQRSLSLTRLNAIMAAAAAGPMDVRESEKPHFHMEI
ncbi:cyclin-dependent kinase 11B [Kryptolebias marmoratus]|uniref:cyclin-dependent kinase 11B n=1 Tax=Kryptolebias marmoratus TaxID=37003 RepID=UPI0007F8F30A|nr:cyclin-dependent kinase 11B [Kryptolebias marmoratus]